MPQLRDISAIAILASNVRRYRIAKNLSQEALANHAGIEYSQVSRIERELLNTSISVVFALARALEVEPSKLLEK
ncbi:DNA-binding transcriptional regulator, XRE-family HTH domain [Mucilaginibacter sp. OK268]|uniref:helix-turn-helix domain-containing protein n=1 Tax=Mucilaginibacter sp. OK268 TaxID=1881048 RepID=UPI00088D46AB|nr:DNA-binding transcriptional regulator, XRE-family HTH domain [Mucilaginibacter sp. OK268]